MKGQGVGDRGEDQTNKGWFHNSQGDQWGKECNYVCSKGRMGNFEIANSYQYLAKQG